MYDATADEVNFVSKRYHHWEYKVLAIDLIQKNDILVKSRCIAHVYLSILPEFTSFGYESMSSSFKG